MDRAKLSTLLSGKTRSQKVVVERHEVGGGVEWWVMLNDGAVEVLDTAEWALKTVSKMARKGNRGVTVTTVEWRGCPEGWKPPSLVPETPKRRK